MTHASISCKTFLWRIFLFLASSSVQAQYYQENWASNVANKLDAIIIKDSLNEDLTFFAQSKKTKLWGYGQCVGPNKIQLYVPMQHQQLVQLNQSTLLAKKYQKYGLIKIHFHSDENEKPFVPFLFIDYRWDNNLESVGAVKLQNKNKKWGLVTLRQGFPVVPFWYDNPKDVPLITYSESEAEDFENKELWDEILKLPLTTKELNLEGKQLRILHPQLSKFKAIEHVNLNGNHLSEIPNWFKQLKLKSLNIFGNTYNGLVPAYINTFNTLKVLKFGWHDLSGRWVTRNWYTPLVFDKKLFGNRSFEEIHHKYYCQSSENDTHVSQFLASLPNLKAIQFYRGASIPVIPFYQWQSKTKLQKITFGELMSKKQAQQIIDDIGNLPGLQRFELNCLDTLNLEPLKNIRIPKYIKINYFVKNPQGGYTAYNGLEFDNTLEGKTREEFLELIEKYSKK